MKRIDLHVRLKTELFKKLGALQKELQKETGLPVSMNDLINMLLAKGSKK